MEINLDTAGERRLDDYFDRIGEILRLSKARASFAVYAMGIFGDGERKSVEPIAARAAPHPNEVDAMHQRLLHFVNNSPWSDREVRRYATRYALGAMTEMQFVNSWIVDDTGFLKQGKHSVGVKRQYSGSAGKITNCQIGVSLSLATATEHVPVDFALYLPEEWANDVHRRREARIPDDVGFKTKPELALDLIRSAVADGLPRAPVLADEAYGNSSAFRAGLRALGLHYAVSVKANTKVCRLDDPSLTQHPIDLHAYAMAMAATPKAFRRVTWREGTKQSLSARFCTRRVIPAHDDGTSSNERERVLLVMEWRDGEKWPAHFHFCVVPQMAHSYLIRLIKERWRTERVYEDMKGELGLDHFEGRRFPGWHHHVSVVIACYAFIVAERSRRFPPSSSRPAPEDRQVALAA
jgi:SRSO17 transposase